LAPRDQAIMLPQMHSRNEAGATKNSMTAWFGFVAIGMWVYHEVAEKEFTAILTVSVFAQALSFAFLQMQISASKSVAGISGKALIMHAVKLCCKLSSTLFLDGYLPTDKSGDWMYQLADVLSLMMVVHILFSVHVTFKSTYQSDEDSLDIRNLIMGAFVLAVLIHPDMNSWVPFDIIWAAFLYIDAVAMVPQLWMISKADGRVKGFTSHYIAATLVSNFLSALFWFFAAPELGEEHDGINFAGLAINGAHAVQLLLLMDFGYYYAKACLQGKCLGGASTMRLGIDI